MLGGMHSTPGHSALRRGRTNIAGQVYLVTTCTHARERRFDTWDTGHAASLVIGEQSVWKPSRLLAWVLMPDHWHGLIELSTGDCLSRAMRRFKAKIARAVNQSEGRRGALWAQSFHDRALRRDEDARAAARYLIANPIRAGIVDCPGDYPFWDAVWLAHENPL